MKHVNFVGVVIEILLKSQCSWRFHESLPLKVLDTDTIETVQRKFFDKYCSEFDYQHILFPDMFHLELNSWTLSSYAQLCKYDVGNKHINIVQNHTFLKHFNQHPPKIFGVESPLGNDLPSTFFFIFLQIPLADSGETIKIKVGYRTELRYLKRFIEQKRRIPVYQQNYFFEGKHIDEDELRQYGTTIASIMQKYIPQGTMISDLHE